MVLLSHELSAAGGGDVQKSEALAKRLGLPEPKKPTRVKTTMNIAPPASVGNDGGPVGIDKKKKSVSIDPQTGAAEEPKQHSLRSGQVVGQHGGVVPSREPGQP
jgi:hypothetical protein